MNLDSLVSVQWLAAHLTDPHVKIIDASWHMPQTGRNGPAEHLQSRIPGSLHFDIETIADRTNPLPHMVPLPEDFGAAVSAMGIENNDAIVIYDVSGNNMTAARVWWMFRLFGHDRVALLDGGFKAWQDAGGSIESGDFTPPTPTAFKANFRPQMLANILDVQQAVTKDDPQILDARAAERFEGRVPEPRPGLAAGHMPGARNLPYSLLTDPETGRFQSNERIRDLFSSAGIDLARPIIASCGSGVTACVLAFALNRLGHENWSVYDGSWTEWGQRADLGIETGPVK